VNVAEHFSSSVRERRAHAAVLEPSGRRSFRATTFGELEQRCDALGHGLLARGIRPGDRIALFVRPGRDLIAVTYALWKIGAVPILIDPGMGRANVAGCLARTKPRVLIGVLLSHVLRALEKKSLRSIEIALLVGPAWTGIETLASVARPSLGALRACARAPSDTAAILFTSGSTGPPKGVVYSHAHFGAQLASLRALYGFTPGERDLACFPLFALFDAALGTTAVIPRLDPLHPAACDPADIAQAILAHGCTFGFGSPAIWRRVAPWAIARGVTFPTLTRALIAGAPVSPALVADLSTRLSDRGDVHTPYGATECLPVSSISGREIADGVRELVEGGHGSCVGRPAPGIEVAIVPIARGALNAVEPLPVGIIGEICVRGPVVTRSYADDEDATRRAKIVDGEALWHRLGDAGYFDKDGRLWTVGRVAHGVETRSGTQWPVPLENVCDLHPQVRRTALVGDGERATLVVEPHGGERRSAAERSTLLAEMRALVAAKEKPGAPAPLTVPERLIECGRFPVDVRHNAKIRREDLSELARERAT
jgi:acyl-CoA synthetase (AMP-forming)/AMP-acid ligase II